MVIGGKGGEKDSYYIKQPKWGKIGKKTDKCMCITKLFFCTPETNTILIFNYTQIFD